MSTAPSFQRARSPAHKSERREAILQAAAELAIRDGVRQVTLTDIAARVGIHKSALLRYFETREQLFLELTGRSWLEWAEAVRAELGALAAQPGDTDTVAEAEANAVAEAAPVADADAVAIILAREFAARPLLCDLIPHTALNLERHASVEAVRAYKLTSLSAVQQAADAVAWPLPELADEDRRQLISTLALLAGSMYQIATPPPPLAALYLADPRLGHALIDLEPRLTRAAQITIAGLRALKAPTGRLPSRLVE